MNDTLKIDKNGKVDESWLDGVLTENSSKTRNREQLTPEFGACCIRFVDSVICNPNYGYVRLDKLTKAEVCSKVYLHLCKAVARYDTAKKQKPSSWMITVAKNAISNCVRDVIQSREVSDIVALVVGADTLTKLDGIDRNAPQNQMLAERVGILSEFRLNNAAKANIFGHVWRDCWFLRDGKTLVERARRHKELQSSRIAKQADIGSEQRQELLKLLEERKNGR